MDIPSKRVSLRVPLIVAGGSITACCLVLLLRELYILGVWDSPNIINFLSAWIPFVLSILLAFIPDSQMKTATRIYWRVGVITCGLFYSILLWHQQSLMQELADHNQRRLLGEAVTQSNVHSDGQIGYVRADVKGLKDALAGTASKNDLTDMSKKITDFVARSEADINGSIGKVNKPDPPELASLKFSLWQDGIPLTAPMLSRSIRADKDGNFPVDFIVTNASGVPADALEIWAAVCDLCSFATEPSGFDKPPGSDEHMRHRLIGDLNPGISFARITLTVKPVAGLRGFDIAFKYSCKTCGKMAEPQIVTIVELSSAKQSRLGPATSRKFAKTATPPVKSRHFFSA